VRILGPHLIADRGWPLVLRPQSLGSPARPFTAFPLDAARSLHHIVSSAAT
jgi:hypothetical protein